MKYLSIVSQKTTIICIHKAEIEGFVCYKKSNYIIRILSIDQIIEIHQISLY